jgi:hypothetical protein
MDNQTEQNFLRLVTAEVTQAIAQALETLIHKKSFELPIYIWLQLVRMATRMQ